MSDYTKILETLAAYKRNYLFRAILENGSCIPGVQSDVTSAIKRLVSYLGMPAASLKQSHIDTVSEQIDHVMDMFRLGCPVMSIQTTDCTPRDWFLMTNYRKIAALCVARMVLFGIETYPAEMPDKHNYQTPVWTELTQFVMYRRRILDPCFVSPVPENKFPMVALVTAMTEVAQKKAAKDAKEAKGDPDTKTVPVD